MTILTADEWNMSIVRICTAPLFFLLSVFLYGFTPAVHTTIHFAGLKNETDKFSFYLDVEKAVQEAGFKRELWPDNNGNKNLERVEGREFFTRYYLSKFIPTADLPGERYISVKVFYLKKDGNIKVNFSQTPADHFSETSETLFRNLVTTLRNKFGRDKIVIEEKMKSIVDQQNKGKKN